MERTGPWHKPVPTEVVLHPTPNLPSANPVEVRLAFGNNSGIVSVKRRLRPENYNELS